MNKLERFFENLKDALMFREGSSVDNILTPPVVTTGSIVWGVLLRSLIIIAITLFLVLGLEQRELWWASIFIFWFVVAYPAYRQYSKYHERIADFSEEILCGKCKHFVSQSQLCELLDEHISIDSVPCEGESWEPKSNITE